MKDVIDFIRPLVLKQDPFVLVTVLKTWGSSPRKQGAHMVIERNGGIAGSVSGGCVEGDVANRSKMVLEKGSPVLVHYGVTDEDAWNVGLSCGGKIDVFLQPFFQSASEESDKVFWESIFSCIDDEIAAVLVHQVSNEVNRVVLSSAPGQDDWRRIFYEQAIKERRHLEAEHESDTYFFEVIPPRSRLILIGSSHIAADLVHFAAQLDFKTIVIDPRGFFAKGTHFKTGPDVVYQKWPAEVMPDIKLDQFTYAVTLTHDPKIDDQALHQLLRSEVAYIGALGSRKTHQKRRNRLSEAGFSEQEIDRIYGPVGMDIHAQTAQEIALSIVSQMVQAKNHFI